MATAIRRPRGVFVFRSAVGSIDLARPAGRNPNIAGWVLRDKWASVQPLEAKAPDFSRLLAAAKSVAIQGKQWQLEVFGGESAPAWAGSMRTQLDTAYRMNYLALVAKMGATFANDPNLVAVHCCLPMTSSPEFRLPDSLNKPGWQTKALAANASALTALGRAFPGIVITVNLHNPVNAADGFVAAQIAQGRSLLGDRFCVQENAWNAKATQANYNVYRAVQEHAAAGYCAGLEQVQVSTDSAYGGTWAESLKYIGKASYLIIYEPDDKRVTGPLIK